MNKTADEVARVLGEMGAVVQENRNDCNAINSGLIKIAEKNENVLKQFANIKTMLKNNAAKPSDPAKSDEQARVQLDPKIVAKLRDSAGKFVVGFDSCKDDVELADFNKNFGKYLE